MAEILTYKVTYKVRKPTLTGRLISFEIKCLLERAKRFELSTLTLAT